jgi:hypothetical protein
MKMTTAQEQDNPVAAEATSSTKPAKTRKVGTAAKKAAKRPSKAIVTKSTKVKSGKKVVRKTNGDDPRLVPANLEAYHVDKDKKTAGGNPSIDSNDKVAIMLRGRELDEVYAQVAKRCEVTVKELKTKYSHLNPGMQRMNLGNKLRGVLNASA